MADRSIIVSVLSNVSAQPLIYNIKTTQSYSGLK